MADDLTIKQEEVIKTLILFNGSVRDVSNLTGISVRTIYRWKGEDELFQKVYREERRRGWDAARAVLKANAKAAADTLVKNLSCQLPSSEINSARLVLEFVRDDCDFNDMAERQDELESRIHAVENGGKAVGSQSADLQSGESSGCDEPLPEIPECTDPVQPGSPGG